MKIECRAKLALVLLWPTLAQLLAPSVSSQMTDAEHSGLVDLHNRLRRSVQPEAANMNQLVASATLRSLAQQAADTCRFEHNYGGAYAGKGENLFLGGSNASLAVMLWFIERENYRLSTSGELCGVAYGNGRYPQYASACGHYYQVAQASIREVGCGKKDCSGNVLIVCEYNSGSGSPPYSAGSACSSCGSAYPRCLDGLCVSAGTAGSVCSLACKTCPKLVGAGSNSTDPCDCSGTYSPCTKCNSDATPCFNNGTDIGASVSNCTCACPTDFYGDQCQYNRAQFTSALQLRFGGELRSRSYFPVPKSFWPSLWLALESPLLAALTDFCRSNFTVCCPSSGASAAPSNASIMAPGDLRLAASGINVTATGELAVSLIAPAAATVVFCGGGGGINGSYASFLASGALISSLAAQRASLLAPVTFACCGVNLTRVTGGLDQALYWPEGQGAGGGGGGSGGGRGDSTGGSSSLQSSGEPFNSAGAALLAVACVGTIVAAAAAVAHRLIKGPAAVARVASQTAAVNHPQSGPDSQPVASNKQTTVPNPNLLVERL